MTAGAAEAVTHQAASHSKEQPAGSSRPAPAHTSPAPASATRGNHLERLVDSEVADLPRSAIACDKVPDQAELDDLLSNVSHVDELTTRCPTCGNSVVEPATHCNHCGELIHSHLLSPAELAQVKHASDSHHDGRAKKAHVPVPPSAHHSDTHHRHVRRKKSMLPLGIAIGAGVLLLALAAWMVLPPRGPVLASDELRAIIDPAVTELQLKSNVLLDTIPIQESEWNLDQEKGTLEFKHPDGRLAVAPVQIIGTYNARQGTWLWSWANSSVQKSLTRDAEVVRKYAQDRHLPELAENKLTCQESDCWEMTALACKLADAQGAYRGPSGDVYVFMTYGKFKISKSK